jgi:hypothetical protein
LDAGDEGMAIGMALCAVVKGLEDDSFAAGIASTCDEDNLAGFQDCQVSIFGED